MLVAFQLGNPFPEFLFIRTFANHLPISILPLFGKVLEALINSKLVKHQTLQDFLSDKQYGFYFSRSVADMLTVIAESIKL